jgi:plasmid stabilization system protein ParE
MLYNIEWLDDARTSLDAEMEYVYAEFGLAALRKFYGDLLERVSQLQVFPRIGIRCRNLDYRGYEMRILHVKKISVVYSIVGDTILILYIWNNRQDPEQLAKVLGLM